MQALRDVGSLARRWPAWVPDGLLALALAVVEISTPWIVAGGRTGVSTPPYDGPLAVALLVWLGATLPLVLRRRYPLGVAFAILVASAIGLPFQVPHQGFGMLVGAYSMGLYGARPRSRVAIAVMLGGVAALLLAAGLVRLVPVNLLIVAGVWFLGDNAQTRRRYTRELEDRTVQLARERDNRARLAVAQMRSGIARDLHDVLAHSVSVMVVQAAAARRTLHSDPERAEDALLEVERTGRQSMVELRRLLGLLREEQDADPALRPQPRLGQLDELIRGFREAGLPVDLVVEGDQRPLGSGVDLSAYRIIQEALTNSLKHAGGSGARVTVTYGARALQVTVEDHGNGHAGVAPAQGAGKGLIGMRERAALVGGTFEAGQRPDGGFRVAALLPVEAS